MTAGAPAAWMALILSGALWLRFWGLAWGLPDTYHGDETTVVGIAVRFGTGDLNPHNFRYPTAWPYLLGGALGLTFLGGRGLGHFVSAAAFQAQYFLDPSLFYLVGRALSALCGTLTVYLTYRLGQQLFVHPTGLIAAGMLAVSPLHVLISHLLVTDVPLTFAMLLALLTILWSAERGGPWRSMLAGLATGLAASVKYPGASLLPALVWAHLGRSPWRVLVALGGAMLGFLLGTPYALVDFETFRGWIAYHSTLSREVQMGVTPDLNGWAFYLGTVLPHGLGSVTAGLAVAGFVLIGVRSLRARTRALQATLLVPLAVLPVFATSTLPAPRYLLPGFPIFCVLAAELLRRGWRYRSTSRRAWRALGLWGSVALALLPPLWIALCQDRRMAGPDTRALAGAWVRANVPSHSRVASESYGPGLPLDPARLEADLAVLDGLGPGSPEAVRQRARTAAKFAVLREAPHRGPVFVVRTLGLAPVHLDELPYDMAALERAGVDYVITSSVMTEHLRRYPETGAPALYEALERRATKVWRLDPGGPPAPESYETGEFWMASCARSMTGPVLTIYRLGQRPR